MQRGGAPSPATCHAHSSTRPTAGYMTWHGIPAGPPLCARAPGAANSSRMPLRVASSLRNATTPAGSHACPSQRCSVATSCSVLPASLPLCGRMWGWVGGRRRGVRARAQARRAAGRMRVQGEDERCAHRAKGCSSWLPEGRAAARSLMGWRLVCAGLIRGAGTPRRRPPQGRTPPTQRVNPCGVAPAKGASTRSGPAWARRPAPRGV